MTNCWCTKTFTKHYFNLASFCKNYECLDSFKPFCLDNSVGSASLLRFNIILSFFRITFYLPYYFSSNLGTDYCGKRFVSSEELLVHLKTHTNLSTSDLRPIPLLSSCKILWRSVIARKNCDTFWIKTQNIIYILVPHTMTC